MYTVHATAPANKNNWLFKEGYFPRTFTYKKDAEQRAKEAKQQGGINVKIVKSKE